MSDKFGNYTGYEKTANSVVKFISDKSNELLGKRLEYI